MPGFLKRCLRLYKSNHQYASIELKCPSHTLI